MTLEENGNCKEMKSVEIAVPVKVQISDFVFVNKKVLGLSCVLGAIFFMAVGALLGVRYLEHFSSVVN